MTSHSDKRNVIVFVHGDDFNFIEDGGSYMIRIEYAKDDYGWGQAFCGERVLCNGFGARVEHNDAVFRLIGFDTPVSHDEAHRIEGIIEKLEGNLCAFSRHSQGSLPIRQ